MKIGVCTQLDNAEILNNIGYDYIELALNGLANMSEQDFINEQAKIKNANIETYAYNCFFPWNFRLTGFETDSHQISEYVKKALERVNRLGGAVVVFGSGGARSFPDGFDKDHAFNQLAEVLYVSGNIAGDNGVTIVIEPLRKEESNIINTVREGLELAKFINHPNIRLLADYYHMMCECENPNIMLEAGCEYLYHLHIANPNGRSWPKNMQESDYASFFNNINNIGYDKAISIEAGNTDNINIDAGKAIELIKGLLVS